MTLTSPVTTDLEFHLGLGDFAGDFIDGEGSTLPRDPSSSNVRADSGAGFDRLPGLGRWARFRVCGGSPIWLFLDVRNGHGDGVGALQGEGEEGCGPR